jgi:hypothetical protein
MRRPSCWIWVSVVALGLVGCTASAGGAGPTSQRSTPAATRPSASGTQPSSSPGPTYHPVIDPARFSARITNPYFPLRPGTTLVYDGVRDDKPQHTEMTVTHETRMIMGVRCVVVRDDVTSSGALVEKTTDWYAQASDGSVWYFGEATAEYVNGQVSNTQGSWEAGVDGAQPGIIMQARPTVGDSYRQEFRPGIAEDTAKILKTTFSTKVAGVTYHNVVVTEDTNPLAPDKQDEKQYAPGVGLIYTVKVSTGHKEVSSYTTKRVG